MKSKHQCFRTVFGCVCVWLFVCTSKTPCGPKALTPFPQSSSLCSHPASPLPAPPGVTPLILTYPMKCLKPLCGNPSAPIRRTLVLWLLRRQGHTLFCSKLPGELAKNAALAHFCRAAIKLVSSMDRVSLSSTKSKSMFVCVSFFHSGRIEGITFIDE